MIEVLDLAIEGTVAWRIDGKVREDDMETALEAAREVIDRLGYVNVYQEIQAFEGIEWDAIEEKMKFLREYGVRHFRRIAVVTDKRWVQRVVSWEDHLFKSVDMRAFSIEDKARARNFLAYAGDDESEGEASAT